MSQRAGFTLLMLVSATSAQVPATRASSVIMPRPPSLPAIVQNILPGEGWVPGTYKLHGQAIIFDTWKSSRRRIAVLESGARIAILSGLSEVIKPDLITVTSPIPELQLNPGDNLLRYTNRGEGNADFWAGGRWYRDLDGSFVTEVDGTGCQSQCKAHVAESGRKTWWFRIRLADGRLGWTDAANSLEDLHP
jgi:hypothetical protein